MPRPASAALLWSPERGEYELTEHNVTSSVPAAGAWLGWLEARPSFAFLGRNGRLNVLKETRNGAGSYWYAYRRAGRQVRKRYAGRSAELSLARLEQIAAELNNGAPITQARQRVPQNATRPASPPLSPLLMPKLQPPRLHGHVIARERLLARLAAGVSSKLTLVSAPAGFGKTTLVRQWIEQRAAQFPAVAWLALDADDNDPLRFWRYLIAACAAFIGQEPAASAALDSLPTQLSFRQSPLEAAITLLLNELAVTGSGVLVLEDYHLIATPQIHETLAFLLEHLPPALRLVLITRQDPPLPLVRLSAAGDLCRISPAELLFSTEEAYQFLHQAAGLPRTPRLIEVLATRVEGWAVGLRLLALALEGQTAPEQIEASLRGFAGTHHAIQEYLLGEVLNEQSASVQRFLLETSMLGRLNASLCDAVTGRNTSAAILKQMDHGNVLLEPLDDANIWYRYHALFATAMQQEARRRLGDARLRELARRAGEWYGQHGMPAEAVEAALQAGDLAHAATLIGRMLGVPSLIGGPHLVQPGYHTLRRWLAQIPDDVLAEQPRLLLLQATAILFTFSLDMLPLTDSVVAQLDSLLRRAEQEFKVRGEHASLGEAFAFRSMILRQRGEFARAAALARDALELLPAEDWGGRSISLNTIGFLDMSSGRLDLAEQSIRDARTLCEHLNNPVYIRANSAMLGWVLFEQGKLYTAEAQLASVLAEARQQGDTDDVGRSLHALAEIAYEWNELGHAARQIDESVALSQHFRHVYEVHLAGLLLQARIESARGQNSQALAGCVALRERAEGYQTPTQRSTYSDVCLWQAWFHLRTGEPAAARRVLAALQPWPEQALLQRDRERRMHARLLLAEDRPAAALELMQKTLSALPAGSGERARLHTQALLALAYAAVGQGEQARQILYDMLVHAHSEGYIRLFLDEGQAMAELLRGLLPRLREKHLGAYARQILRAFAAPQPGAASTAPNQLSAQEGRVLHLLALGHSNQQIARDLVVSINTIKAHLKNIYRKLGVSSRAEAAAARTLAGDAGEE